MMCRDVLGQNEEMSAAPSFAFVPATFDKNPDAMATLFAPSALFANVARVASTLGPVNSARQLLFEIPYAGTGGVGSQ